MTPMQPAGGVREFSGLSRRYALPPYPSPEQLGCPTLQSPPLAPEKDAELVLFGWATYASAMQEFYKLQWTPLLEAPSDPTKTARRRAAVDLVMRDLRSLEIPPAEWVRKRIADFHSSELSELQPRPPTGFVFAHGAVGNAITYDPTLSWLGELSQPRTIQHRAARATIKMWLERRRRTVALASAGKESEIPALWERWTGIMTLCRMDGAQAQKQLDKERASGVYLWGQNLLV